MLVDNKVAPRSSYQKCIVGISDMRDVHLASVDLNLLPALEALLKRTQVTLKLIPDIDGTPAIEEIFTIEPRSWFSSHCFFIVG